MKSHKLNFVAQAFMLVAMPLSLTLSLLEKNIDSGYISNTPQEAILQTTQNLNNEHDVSHANWETIEETGGSLNESSYFLDRDISLSQDLIISGAIEVTLCLNGNVLQGTGKGSVITIDSGATLNICDCQDGSTSVTNTFGEGENQTTYNSGVITGGGSQKGGALYVSESSKVNMFGGAIAYNEVEETIVFHYNRTNLDYGDWALWIWEDQGQEGAEYYFTGTDTFGALASFPISTFGEGVSSDSTLGLIIKTKGDWNSAIKDYEGDRYIDLSSMDTDENNAYHVYLYEGDANVYTAEQITTPGYVAPTEPTIAVHYFREDLDYGNWELHMWEVGGPDGTEYSFTETDTFGAIATESISTIGGEGITTNSTIGFIVKSKGSWDATDPNNDNRYIYLSNLEMDANNTFHVYIYQGDANVYTTDTSNVLSSSAIYLDNNSSFEMNGGNITKNFFDYSVYVGEGSSFLMNEGVIDVGIEALENTNIYIEGGFVSGTFILNENTNVSITGGNFASELYDVVLDKVDEGYILVDVSSLGGTSFDSDYNSNYPYIVYKLGVYVTEASVTYGETYTQEDLGIPSSFSLNFSWTEISNSGASAGKTGNNLPIDVGTYNVTASFNSSPYLHDGNGVKTYYEDFTFELTIKKATLIPTIPTDFSICVDFTLEDIVMPSDAYGIWSWDDASIELNNSGTHSYNATYVPFDTENYEVFQTSIEVTVNEHTGGEASCTYKATCNVCAFAYGDLKEHSYYTSYEGDEHYQVCEDCDDTINRESHSLTIYVYNDDETHYQKCDGCDYTSSELIHTLDEYVTNEEGHYLSCDCGYHLESESHSFTDWEVIKEATESASGEQNRRCTTCGYVETQSIEYVYTINTIFIFLGAIGVMVVLFGSLIILSSSKRKTE